jgi:Tol biopolymer transport system component
MSIQPRRLKCKISPFWVLRATVVKTRLFYDIIVPITITVLVLSVIFNFNGCHKEEEIAISSDIWPAWSPDGRYIAFYRGSSNLIYIPEKMQDTISGIKILDLETHDVVDLVVGGEPDWAPDENKIIFAGEKINIIDIATGEITMLTEGGSPDWSSDGSKILFVRGYGVDTSSIFMMDTSGSNIKMLFNSAWEPDWHPSGDRLIFSGRMDEWGIYMGDTNGNVIRPIRLSSDSLIPAFAKFSPDGAWIVYADIFHSEKGKNCFVHIMDSLGDNDIKLTDGVYPAWSPDGKKIVFARYSDEEEATALWIMNSDGSAQVRITDSEYLIND